MTSLAPDALFGSAALSRLERRLGFPGRDSSHFRRAVALLCIGWVPLLTLASLQEGLLPGTSLRSFLMDIGVHCRALIAAPVLILAEAICVPQLSSTCRHFVTAGLVDEAHRVGFEAAQASTRRLEASRWARVCLVLLAYALVYWLAVATRSLVPSWQLAPQSAIAPYSPAGWWHVLVTSPALMVLVLTWFYRLGLWGRLLWKLSRLGLRLTPAHPDRAGGLQFVVYSIRAFAWVGFAVCTVVAGAIANDVLLHGLDLNRLRNAAIGMLGFVVVVFGAPVLVFARPLASARFQGIQEYGALANGVGRRFEEKWLRRPNHDESVLVTQDFSAVADLYETVAKVYAMKILLIDPPTMLMFAGMSLLPLGVVGLFSLPLELVRSVIADLFF